MVQTDRKTLEYVVIKETGPAHDKEFVVNVVVEDYNTYGVSATTVARKVFDAYYNR